MAKKAAKTVAKKAVKKAGRGAIAPPAEIRQETTTTSEDLTSKVTRLETLMNEMVIKVDRLEEIVVGMQERRAGPAATSKSEQFITDTALLQQLAKLAPRSTIAPWVKMQDLLRAAGVSSEDVRAPLERAFLNDKIELGEGGSDPRDVLVTIRGKAFGRVRLI